MFRQYYLLLHHSMSDQALKGFEKVAHGSILEMNVDGVVFLWPAFPHTQAPGSRDFCSVCMRFLESSEHPDALQFQAQCKLRKYPAPACAFEPAPEAAQIQDFEDLFIDGSYLAYDSSYFNVSDFLQAHDISHGHFIAIPLGTFETIRSCREWLLESME